MDVVALTSIVVALLPLAWRGRPIGRLDREDEARAAPEGVEAGAPRAAER